MQIGDTPITSDSVYFIAEAGVNHNGNLSRAKELVDAAAESGADAVKFQTFQADQLVTSAASMTAYQEQTVEAESQHEMLQQYELARDDYKELQQQAAERDITFLSTPFDLQSATLLDELGVPAIKLGSGEITNLPLLKHASSFGRPLIISTGMATLPEVKTAVNSIEETAPDSQLALLHCTSAYPTSIADVNLRVIETLKKEFSVPIGYSDHTESVEMPGFATVAGAQIVEKHFTMDNSLPGPDHAMSLEPPELERAVSIARDAVTTLGTAEKTPVRAELANKEFIRKGLHTTERIPPGTRFTERNVSIKRPERGLLPENYERILGREASNSLAPGDPITEQDVSGL